MALEVADVCFVLVIVCGVGCLRLALVDVGDVCLKLVAWGGRLKELILLKAEDVFFGSSIFTS